jgi:hypothetical protein
VSHHDFGVTRYTCGRYRLNIDNKKLRYNLQQRQFLPQWPGTGVALYVDDTTSGTYLRHIRVPPQTSVFGTVKKETKEKQAEEKRRGR